MQGINYIIGLVFAIMLGGGAIVAYRQAKKNVNPSPNLPSTIGMGYNQRSFATSAPPTKSPGCGCGKST